MSRTNLAYQQEEPKRRYEAQPIPLPRPRLRTIEGQGRAAATQTARAPWTRTLAVMSIVVFMVMASVSITRINISNATVLMMQTANQTSSDIEQARIAGMELEVEHSLKNNPTRIQDIAATMGILPTAQPEVLAALDGFAPETIYRMNQAAEQNAALELRALKEAAEKTATERAAQAENALEPSVYLSIFNPATGAT